MTDSSRGYVTIAVRRQGYLKMAVDMRLSMREHSPYPTVLAADKALAAVARRGFPGVFEDVVVVRARCGIHRAMQFGAGEASPFEQTIFVDADCLLLSDPIALWPGSGSPVVVMHGDRLSRDSDAVHHGFSTRDLMRRFGLDVCLKTNGGVFYFRGADGRAHLEECLRVYVDEVLPELSEGPNGAIGIALRSLLGGFLGAELAFGVVGGRRDFGTFPPPGPMYWS